MSVTYDNKIQQALVAVEAEETHSDTVTLSTGVVLKLRKVNVLRIQAVMDKFKYPPIPTVFDEERGRYFTKEDDENYQRDCAIIDNQRSMAVLDAIAAMGTEVLSVPENLPAVDNDAWIDDVAVIGLDVNRNSRLARYLAWIKYVAILDTDDLTKIATNFGVTLGVSQEKIADNLQGNFPDNTTRDAA